VTHPGSVEAQAVEVPLDTAEGRDHFPYGFALDFLLFLRRNRRLIRVITYADFDFAGDLDYENNYPHEFAQWKQRVRETPWMQESIFLLLQHDVDSLPDHSMRMLVDERRLGLKSNVMIFRSRINRHLLKTQNMVRETEYPLDFELLSGLARRGFVVGYHCNAYERAGFDAERAAAIFTDDVTALRQRFDIRFFSPHGGVRGPDGSSNNVLCPPQSLRSSLRWIHNRHTVRFHGQYSDGGINNPKRDITKLDLVSFVSTWQLGKRYRVLLHPQYYGERVAPAARLVGLEWYDRLLAAYERRRGPRRMLSWRRGDPWRSLELPRPPRKPSIYKRLWNAAPPR
jgi:hypothetical protein